MTISRIPKTGEIYRHFKNKLYQIVAIATHSETRESYVVYQALYDDFRTYIRPLDMFISEVDHEKYPTVTQKYRFEKVDRKTLESSASAPLSNIPDHIKSTPVKENFYDSKPADTTSHITDEDEDLINPLLIKFLDADTYREKSALFSAMYHNVDDRLANDISVSLDLPISDISLDQKLDQIRDHLNTQAKFEFSRSR